MTNASAMSGEESDAAALRALLHWYCDSGVLEATGSTPQNLFAAAEPAPAPAKKPARPVATIVDRAAPTADEALRLAEAAARGAASLDALAVAVAAFGGCALKRGARNTVFIDGAPDADLLVIGEGPGRDEDRIGKPFVGRAGQLLDRMLAAIGRSRARDTLISNVVFWRPPGNRTPTREETAVCRPFVMRLIELTAPKAILLAGGVPMEALLGQTGIMRNRGVWRDVALEDGRAIPALPIFHPAFLLRQPAQKRLAWRDLQTLNARLRDS